MRTVMLAARGLIVCGLLVSGPSESVAQSRLALQPESKVWIEGASTVNEFRCDAGTVSGEGTVPSTFASDAQSVSTGIRIGVEMEVPARSLDCGNRQMNRDLMQAMDADRYPHIRFRLTEVEALRPSQNDGDWFRYKATGWLTIAGGERRVELDLLGRRQEGDQLRLRGSTDVLMTDFGIEPPTAMFGLIKARDALRVHFDVVARCGEGAYASTQ